jgi:hypothetical protein
MKLVAVILIFLMSACSYNQPILEHINLDANKKHLIVIESEGGALKVISENADIIKYAKAIEIETNRSCEGTTNDYQIIFYEGQKEVGRYAYCSFFITQDLDFGSLKSKLKPASQWETDSLSFEAYKDSLAKYSKQQNIYVYGVKPVQEKQERVRYVMEYYKW